MKKIAITIIIISFLIFVLPHLITYDQMFTIGILSIMGLLMYFIVDDYYNQKKQKTASLIDSELEQEVSLEEKKPLRLVPLLIDEDYRKKWYIHQKDFFILVKGDEQVGNSIYRTGMLNGGIKDGYFLLLKYTEEYYDDSITRDKDRQRHFEGKWCILDKEGNEVIKFESFDSPYLSGGVIYSLNGKYYNIETGKSYGSTNNSISCDDYIFLEDRYNKDKTKRGVLKIKKSDGSVELFSNTNK